MNCLLKNTLGIVILVVSLSGVSIYSMDIFNAAKTGNVNRVRELIAAGADVNQQDNNGYTPLHWAAENGHQTVVQALIAAGANVNQPDNDGRIPLHWAAENDHQAIVQVLIAAGADVNRQNNDGVTPLYGAAAQWLSSNSTSSYCCRCRC